MSDQDAQPETPPDAKRSATVRIDNGLHMRPVMAFVDVANRYASDILIRREPGADHEGRLEADGKSLYQVIELAAPDGTVLHLEARGNDAEQAVNELAELVEGGYED